MTIDKNLSRKTTLTYNLFSKYNTLLKLDNFYANDYKNVYPTIYINSKWHNRTFIHVNCRNLQIFVDIK